MAAKRFFRMFCLLAAAFLLCSCSVMTQAAGQESGLPEIVIGTDSYEPYSDLNTAMKPVAVDVELATEAFRRMGYQAVFRKIDWKDRDELLASGEIDCLWSEFTMEGKEDLYQWAGPYLYASEVVVVREDGEIRTLADLAGKRVAVQAGSLTEGHLLRKEYPGMPEIGTLYSFDTITQVRTSLSKGYADAIMGFEGEMLPLLENSPEDFRTLDETLQTHALGVAFAKNYDVLFVVTLKEILEEMNLDGTTAGIVEKYGMDAEIALGGK